MQVLINKKIWILICVFLPYLPCAVAQPTLYLTDHDDQIKDAGKQTLYYEDKTNQLTIQEITSIRYDTAFRKSSHEVINFSHTQSTIWLKIKVKNQSQQLYLIEFSNPSFHHIRFFHPNPKVPHNYRVEQTGALENFALRKYKTNYFTFELSESIDTNTVIYYIAIKSDHPVGIPVKIGSANAFINKNHWENIILGGYAGLVIVMFIYNFLVFIMLRDKVYLYYSFSTLFAGIGLSYLNAGYNFEYLFNHRFFNYYIIAILGIAQLFTILFTIHFLKIYERNRLFLRIFQTIIIFVVIIVFANVCGYNYALLVELLQIIILLTLLFSVFVGSYFYLRKIREARFYIIGWLVYTTGVYIYLMATHDFLPRSYLTTIAAHLGNSFEIVCFAFALADRINIIRQQNEKMLKQQNQDLEVKVQERTEELQVLNEELNSTVEELSLTLETLDEQKKIVDGFNRKMMASINYAQNIQQVILPDEQTLKNYLKDYFLIYKPKDIVSGDFYWVANTKKGYYIAIADCTGHGVAGSFMALLGINLLNNLKNDLEHNNPAEIIKKLNEGINQILKQDERKNYKEGMDIALCRIEPIEDNLSFQVTFAGAKRPLYLATLSTSQLIEIKGDRYSVGVENKQQYQFLNHHFSLDKGDMIYLFSDGFADQNNEKRKRLGDKMIKNILNTIKSEPISIQKKRLEQTLTEHQTITEQRDDITFLGIKL